MALAHLFKLAAGFYRTSPMGILPRGCFVAIRDVIGGRPPCGDRPPPCLVPIPTMVPFQARDLPVDDFAVGVTATDGSLNTPCPALLTAATRKT